MKIIVDKLPQNPKECIFSEKTYSDSYVCGFHDCVSCNPKTCEYLSEQTYITPKVFNRQAQLLNTY